MTSLTEESDDTFVFRVFLLVQAMKRRKYEGNA